MGRVQGCKKGQVNSMDALLSVMVFAMLLVFLFASWMGGVLSAKNAVGRNRMEYAALSASELLMESGGMPQGWETNSSGVLMLGLANSQNTLSAAKVANFSALPYETSRGLLGTASEFYFVLQELDGGTLYSAGNSTLLGSTKVAIERYGMMGNKKVRMRLVFYQ